MSLKLFYLVSFVLIKFHRTISLWPRTHVLHNDWTHAPPSSRSSSGSLHSSLKHFLFSTSILPFTVSRFSSIDLIQSTTARSTSRLVTTRGCCEDSAVGLESTCSSSSCRCFIL